jgi:xylose isomerase
MQVRPYDNAEQGIDRVVRSILSWEACGRAERELDYGQLNESLEKRDTARAEDIMHEAVHNAFHHFKEFYAT